MKKFFVNWDVTVLAIIALLALLYDFINIFWGLGGGKLINVVLFLLALAAIAITIERFKHIDELKSNLLKLQVTIENDNKKSESINTVLYNIQDSLNSINNFKVIEDANNIIGLAKKLISKTKTQIRSTYLGINLDAAKDVEYNNHLLSVLVKAKEDNKRILYRSVYQEGTSIQSRIDLFNSKEVLDYTQFLKVENAIHFNILIIDESDLLLAFPEIPGENQNRNCIYIHDNKNFIGAMCNWYDNYVWKLK